MRLRVTLPAELMIDQEVTKVVAEAENGSFCLLPRHVCFVTALVPGVISYLSVEGKEEYVATDKAILVKCGDEVVVSTGNAALGSDLGTLRKSIETHFRRMDDRERRARSAVAKLEANLVRKFMELERHGL